MFTKRSHIIKQTCSLNLQVCLSMCNIFVNTRHERVKKPQTFLKITSKCFISHSIIFKGSSITFNFSIIELQIFIFKLSYKNIIVCNCIQLDFYGANFFLEFVERKTVDAIICKKEHCVKYE